MSCSDKIHYSELSMTGKLSPIEIEKLRQIGIRHHLKMPQSSQSIPRDNLLRILIQQEENKPASPAPPERMRELMDINQVSDRRKRQRVEEAKDIFKGVKRLLSESPTEMQKLFSKKERREMTEISHVDSIKNIQRAAIFREIQQSISVESMVKLKDSGISDKVYNEIFHCNELLRQILPIPYHTIQKRTELNKLLWKLSPQETPDGISIDPGKFEPKIKVHSLPLS